MFILSNHNRLNHSAQEDFNLKITENQDQKLNKIAKFSTKPLLKTKQKTQVCTNFSTLNFPIQKVPITHPKSATMALRDIICLKHFENQALVLKEMSNFERGESERKNKIFLKMSLAAKLKFPNKTDNRDMEMENLLSIMIMETK